MANLRKLSLDFGSTFSHGLLAVGVAEPMRDFDAPAKNGERPQAKDPDSGLPIWTLDVIDADPEIRKSERSFSVRIISEYCPALPEAPAGTPAHLAFMRPIELDGLTGSPYVADSPMGNGKGRLAWSFRATGLKAPGAGQAGKQAPAAAPKREAA